MIDQFAIVLGAIVLGGLTMTAIRWMRGTL